MRTYVIASALSAASLLGGCASMDAEIQGIQFPADTPILIADVPYQISTIKCAQIRAIGPDGALDCYDTEGKQSAAITPVSNWRRNLVKENYGFSWGTPEHQAFVFQFFHRGGKEQLAQAVLGSAQQSYQSYAATKGLIATLDKSAAIDAQSAQNKAAGAAAYFKGGMPAWHAHQSKVVHWHLENARYFSAQGSTFVPGND